MYGVLGATGFVGHHLCAALKKLSIPYVPGSRRLDVDARSVDSLNSWIIEHNITHIINLAAECGGIGHNQMQAANLWLATSLINASVLEAARCCEIKKLVMIGTVCSYAKHCPTPFKEDYLMNYGMPESSNAAYGVAKLSGLLGSQAYRNQYGLPVIYLIPVNLYGPHDNFDLTSSHVIPALIRKCVEAVYLNQPTITCWGTGSATREFLYVEDVVDGILKATERYDKPDPVNLGSGSEISIFKLATLIAELTGFKGTFNWDVSKPDGQPKRCLNITRANHEFGFLATTPLRTGLKNTIEWYKETWKPDIAHP